MANETFPIQGEWDRKGKWGRQPACEIPMWLAEEAYKVYARRYRTQQTLKRLGERGGFGRQELLDLLADKFN